MQFPKLKHNLLTVLSRELLANLNHSIKQDNYSIIFGILKLFSYLDSYSIKTYMFDNVSDFLLRLETGEIDMLAKGQKAVSSTPNEFGASILYDTFMVTSSNLGMRHEDP